MPVSCTEKRTKSILNYSDAYPDFSAFGELQSIRDEVTQNLGNFALIGKERRNAFWILEHQIDSLADQQRLQDAAQ